MLANDHQNEVANPNNVESEDKTDQTCNDFAFAKSGDSTANPTCNGDDCENQTYNPAKTEIVSTSFCHNKSPPKKFLAVYIIQHNSLKRNP